MINSINASPSFEGKAVVKFNKNKIGTFRAQLNLVAKNMGKRLQVYSSGKKQVISPEMLEVLEQKIQHDVLLVADISPAARRGNNYNAIIVARDSDDMLLKALKRVFNNDGNADNVMSYAERVAKSSQK